MAHLGHTEDFTGPPTIAQIERQIRWEVYAVERGKKEFGRKWQDAFSIKRGDQVLSAKSGLADTSAGQRIIHELLDKLTPSIAKAQFTLLHDLETVGRAFNWMFLFTLLDASTVSYLTLRAALSCFKNGSGRELDRVATTTATQLAAAMELEVEFRSWRTEELFQIRSARKTGEVYRSLCARVCQAVKGSNSARTWKRWRTRLDTLSRQKWAVIDKSQLGMNCLHLLVETCPDYFQMVNVHVNGGKTRRHLRLSDKVLTIIEDHNARAEVMHPIDRPMLCRPKQWVWQEVA